MIDREEMLAKVLAAPLHFSPGTQYEYSNAGNGEMLSNLDDLYRWHVALSGDFVKTSIANDTLTG